MEKEFDISRILKALRLYNHLIDVNDNDKLHFSISTENVIDIDTSENDLSDSESNKS